MSQPIQVVVADDHGVVREGLRTLLTQAGLQVVALAASGAEAVQLALQHQPQVLLLDIRLPDLDGLQVLETLHREAPEIAVVLLTTYDNPTYLQRALQWNVAGFLTKDTDPQLIPLAVRAAAHGQAMLDRGVLQRALREMPCPSLPDRLHDTTPVVGDLTEQEVRVLQLVAQGRTNQEIADHLHISLNTVKTHLKHIFAKLGVSDRTQAAVWAWRHGLGA